MDTKSLATQQAIENFKKLQAAPQIKPTTQPTQPTGGYFEKGVDFGGIKTASDLLNPVNWFTQIAQDIVNIPSNIIGGAGDILKGQYLRGAGRIGTGAFDIATTLLPIGKVGKLAKVAETALKPTLGQAIKLGAKEGLTLGAISGGFQGLQQAQDVAPDQIFSKIAGNIVTGGLTGGLLGGGAAGITAKLVGTSTTPKIFKGLSEESSIYANKQISKQEAAIQGKSKWLNNFTNELKTKFEDFTTPLNVALDNYEKRTGKTINPLIDPRFAIDRVLNSSTIANQKFISSDYGKVLLEVPSVQIFDQYLIAKEAIARNKEKGLISSIDYNQAQKFINELKNVYELPAQSAYKFNQSLLKDYYDAGLLSKENYTELAKNSQYVPLQRLFENIDNTLKGGGIGVASVPKQNLVKTALGSTREIKNVSESIFANTILAQKQIEKNQAARMIHDLVQENVLPGKIFKKGQNFNPENVIYTLIDGKKVAVDVGKDIATAMKNLSKENVGFIGNLIKFSTRVLQAGAVTFNIPFAIRNLVKDAQTAAIYSKSPLKNSAINPVVWGKALFEIAGKGKLYDDYIKAGIGFSSIDANNLPKTIEKLRQTKNLASSTKYYASNPLRLINLMEEIVGKGEQVARIGEFAKRRDFYTNKGYSINEATTLAANEARNITANFARRGEWSTPLNALIPFFNAGVQGAKQLRTRFIQDPKTTTIKFAATLGLPITAVTLWNLSDPKRKEVYNSIPEYEKERALILLPPVPYTDDKGQIVAIRIPFAPGLSNLVNPLRKIIDGSYASSFDMGAGIASDLSAALYSQPLPLSKEGFRRTVSSVTPQLIKPGIEILTNQNLYTGSPIIPRGKENLPPEYQVREDTSYTARRIGEAFGISPAIVENSIKTSAAGVGTQVLSILDWASSISKDIPQEQQSNKGILTDAFNSFFRTKGGEDVSKLYDQLKVIDQEKALLNLKIKDAIAKGDVATVQSLSNQLTSQQYAALKSSVEKKEITKNLSAQERAIYNLTEAERKSLLDKNPQLQPVINKVTQIKDVANNAISSSFDSSNFSFKSTGKTGRSKKVKKLRIKKPKKVKIKKIKIKKPKKI
jgi:hypothetical protein